MKIDQKVKDFLSANKNLINASDFTALYELAEKKVYDRLISQMARIFYGAGIDPLQYMTSVPVWFAKEQYLPILVIDTPDQIEYIHPYAFAGTNVTKFIAPASLKAIGRGAFSNCDDLTEADFSKCHSCEEIDDYAFSNCPNLKVIKFPKSLHIISVEAFCQCTSLTSIDLSSCHELTEIKLGAFALCKDLTTVYLPNSIEHIVWSAFNTGNPLTIIFDGTQQEWESKFGEEYNKGVPGANSWNTNPSTIDIQYLR